MAGISKISLPRYCCTWTLQLRAGVAPSIIMLRGSLWSPEESALHINLLELRAVRLALCHFQHLLQGRTVGVMADSTTDLAYLWHQGGTHSSGLNVEAQRTLHWVQERSISLRTQFISESRNIVANSFSRKSQVLSTEWTLHQEVCRALWRLWNMVLVSLFATSQNFRIPAYVSPFPDSMTIATDAFLFNWDHQELFAFPPFATIRQLLSKLQSSQRTSIILITPFWPHKEWFPDLLKVTVDGHLLPTRPNLLKQPHFHRFQNGLHALQLTAWRLSAKRAIPEDSRSSR